VTAVSDMTAVTATSPEAPKPLRVVLALEAGVAIAEYFFH